MSTYDVTYELDEAGWWFTYVPEFQGCHTQGRTLGQARERIREALGLFVDDSDDAELIDHVRLPAQVRRALDAGRSARERAERERERANTAMIRAVRALTKDMQLSVRDAAELLGVSYQRVQQLSKAS